MAYCRYKGLEHYARCKKCGKVLLDYHLSLYGFCSKCDCNQSSFSDMRYGKFWSERKFYKTPTEEHIYRRVIDKVEKEDTLKILDVGCGTGVLLSRLSSTYKELHGIDISKQGVRIAKNNCSKNVMLIIGDATHLPYRGNSFDCLTCTCVLQHIQNIESCIKELQRVIKPGGCAFFAVHNGNGPYGEIVHPINRFTLELFISTLKENKFAVLEGTKFGFYIPFITHVSTLLSIIMQRQLLLSTPLDVSLPESLSSSFLVKCKNIKNE